VPPPYVARWSHHVRNNFLVAPVRHQPDPAPPVRCWGRREFQLISSENERVGTLVLREHGAWGLGPFFRRRGVEAGDCLVLTFDLNTRSVAAQVADGAMLDELRDPDAVN
jgi:hypothetical protein